MLHDRKNGTADSLRIGGQNVLSVSGITALIRETVESHFSDICVQGEISQCTRASSGHVYMTLKDDGAVLKSVLWRSTAGRLKFDLEEGLDVICRGGIDVYPPRGSYQLIVREVHPCGLGSLQLAFRQLVKRLEKEGLFAKEHKKPLPAFPEKIGIITSAGGAALRDMLRILRRRWPVASIHLLATPVQGDGAAARIAECVDLLNDQRPDIDVIIVGRGGGSLEDLWAFNEECVARSIFNSKIPVVSAVGHEVDFSVADFVADLRAATPSEAAEKAVPNRPDLMIRSGGLVKRLGRALLGKVERGRERLEALGRRHVFRHPETLFRDRTLRTDELLENMNSAVNVRMERDKQRVDSLNGRLRALSPEQVLHRGYSMTFGPDGKVLRDGAAINKGVTILTRLNNGSLRSKVHAINVP